jgi:hypothetical protein
VPGLIRRYEDARAGGAPEVANWGTGTPRRELLHVDDLASACLFLLEHFDGPITSTWVPASTTPSGRSPIWSPRRWATPAKRAGIRANRTEHHADCSTCRYCGRRDGCPKSPSRRHRGNGGVVSRKRRRGEEVICASRQRYVQLLSRGPVGVVKTQCRVHDLMGGRDDWR